MNSKKTYTAQATDLLEGFYKILESWHSRQKERYEEIESITRETLNAIDHLLNGRSVKKTYDHELPPVLLILF